MAMRVKGIVLVLVAVLGLAAVWPTVAAATQTNENFNQTWMVLGPYYTKEGIGGGPSAAVMAGDYMTDGIIVDQFFIPTTGTVINTNYGLPQCGSYSFVYFTRANGYGVPTILTYSTPGTSPDPSSVNLRGDNTVRPPNCIFDQGRDFNENTDPQGNNRIDYTVTYFWAYANNLTGAAITNARLGTAQDDAMTVFVNGVQRHSPGGGGSGDVNRTNNVSGTFTLNPGPNLVMVKLFNGTGNYRFRLRLQTNSGTQNPVPAGSGIPASQVSWDIVPMGGSYTFPATPVPANSATANRKINSLLNYTPGVPLRVEVTATTSSGHPGSVLVYEWPPDGWTIGTPDVTLGSATVLTTTTYRGSTQMIRWAVGPLTLATSRTARLTYWVTPPVSANSDAVCTGTIISDAVRGTGQDMYVYAPTPSLGLFDWTNSVGSYPVGYTMLTSLSLPSLLPPWFSPHVTLNGDPRFFGSAVYNGTSYTLTGSGTDIWNNDDRFRMAAKVVNSQSFIMKGDLMWTSVATQNSCKVLLMVRSGVSRGAAWGAMGMRNYSDPNINEPLGVPTGWDGRFRRTQRFALTQRRQTYYAAAERPPNGTNDQCTSMSGSTIIPTPFRLIRNGTTIDGYVQNQGQWVRITGCPYTVPDLTSDSVLACLAVCSHIVPSSATAAFQNVSVGNVAAVSARRSLSNNGIYTTQPVTVKIFIRNGGATAAITVRDYAPPGWNITGSTPTGVVDDGSTITWSLGSFSADTTLTYTLVPPDPDYILPGFFGNGFVNDQTNLISGLPITGPNRLDRKLVTTFQQGVLPDPSYNGTFDAHVVMYRSSARYPVYRGPGLNTGWNNELDEGDNHNDLDHNDNKMGMMRFDVGLISPAATVFQAKMLLYHVRNRSAIGLGGRGGGVPYTTGTFHRVYAAKVNKPWLEGTGQGSDGRYANKDEVTWYWAKAFVSTWASGGLRGGALDCDMPESFADATTATRGTWLSWEVTRMVDSWVHAPSGNFGMRLSQDDQNTTHYPWGTYPLATYTPGIVNFATRNRAAAEAWMRPILTVMAYVPNVLAASHWELYR